MSNYASLEDTARIVSATEWLWKGWLPRGHVTLLVGAPGDGKSALSLAVGDRLLKAQAWPDGQENTGASSIMWIDTEGTQAVLVERAITADSPMNRIMLPTADPLTDFALDDDDAWFDLRRGIAATTCGLLVVDTLRGVHSGEENSSQETGRLMKGLQIIARDNKIGCLVVHHTRKLHEESGEDSRLTLDRVRGSNAIVANARVVWGIEPTRADGVKRLIVLKSNLGSRPDPLGFRMDEDGFSWCRLPNTESDAREMDRAAAFLRSWLQSGPSPADALKEAASADGHSMSTLCRAKKRLGIKSERERGVPNGKWSWRLPESA